MLSKISNFLLITLKIKTNFAFLRMLWTVLMCRSATLCKYHMNGACKRGEECPFSHDFTALPNTVSFGLLLILERP